MNDMTSSDGNAGKGTRTTNMTPVPPASDSGEPIWPSWRDLLTDEQRRRINSPIPPKEIFQRQVGGGSSAKYVKKEYLWEELQEIFGHENITRETLDLQRVGDAVINMTQAKGPPVPGFASTWTCKVRLTIRIVNRDGRSATIIREGTGAATFMAKQAEVNVSQFEASEIAIKACETDAFKRACSSLGKRFGLEIETQEISTAILSPSQARLKGVTLTPATTPTAGRPNTEQRSQSQETRRDAPAPTKSQPTGEANDGSNQRATDATVGATTTGATKPDQPTDTGEIPPSGGDPWADDLGEGSSLEKEKPDYASYVRDDWVAAFRELSATVAGSTIEHLELATSVLEDMHPVVSRLAADHRVRTYYVELTSRIKAGKSKLPAGDGRVEALGDRLNRIVVTAPTSGTGRKAA
jgi:hypothetical protein